MRLGGGFHSEGDGFLEVVKSCSGVGEGDRGFGEVAFDVVEAVE